jgi:hypothetical protein
MQDNTNKYEQMNLDLEPIKLECDSGQKQKFQFHRQSGHYVQCPCCKKKYNEIYKRHLYKAIVQGLSNLYHGRGSTSSIGDFAKLRYWGFIERDKTKKRWKITEKGKNFIQGQISVPKTVFIQNGVKLGEDTENQVTIYDIKE